MDMFFCICYDKKMKNKEVTVIIPTLNAIETIVCLLDSLLRQTQMPDEIIVVDSESSDETALLASTYPRTRVIEISRADFDHGGTRDMAFRASNGDIVVFFTQDIVIRDDTLIETLVQATLLDGVACAFGRQIARSDAALYEKYTRTFNYPEQSNLRSAKDISRLGIKAFFLSDVCAAYRRDAYLAVGGFDHPIPTNEDMLIAAKFLHAGYQIAYCAEAVVLHSHRYSWKQEYARNFLIGKVLRQYRSRFSDAKAGPEGIRFMLYVISHLLKRGTIGSCLKFCYLCSAKLLGNRKGSREGAS
jgi:rhamnosyltransferase